MIVVDVEQNTADWLAARLGIPTASKFSSILTPKTRVASSQAEMYLNTLLAERILGYPVTETVTDAMERGRLLEPEAADAYAELHPDREVKRVGFILSDDGRYGASPDRLVDANGLLEIKCPSARVHIAGLRGRNIDDYMSQCQGQLWLTEREWCDLFFYHPGLPPHEARIERDESYIAELKTAVIAFCDRLEEAHRQITDVHPTPQRLPRTPLVA